MPSIKEKKIVCGGAGSGLYGADGEPSGEPAAPRREVYREPQRLGLGEELVDETVGQWRLERAVAELDDEQRAELVDDLLAQMGDEHGQLPEAISDRLVDGLIRGKRGEREILGQDGVLGELTRRLIERALGEELSEHLGYPAGQAPPGGAGNSRNGGTPQDGADRQRPGRDRHSAGSQKSL